MRRFSPETEVLQLLQDLISVESHSDAPGREAAIGRFLLAWFSEHGIDAQLQPVEGDRANVIAYVSGGCGPSLMFNGHLDTVPAGNMADAFSARLRDGEIWGRGACDMKGAIAAMACSLVTAAQQSDTRPLAGDLLFTGTVGEETGSIGVKSLIESGVRTTYAVVGEPTAMRIGIAHKGACFIRILLTGRGAHGSRPDEGVNAVSFSSHIVRALEGDFRTKLGGRMHPLLGASTVNVGRIAGGTQPNIVAETCLLDIDRRTLPNEVDTVGEIERLVAGICSPIDGLSWRVEEMAETSIVPHGPLGTDIGSLLVKSASAACLRNGIDAEPVGVTYWTDGGHLSAAGIETIILGPGDIAHAHGPNERVGHADLIASVGVYRDLVERVLLPS